MIHRNRKPKKEENHFHTRANKRNSTTFAEEERRVGAGRREATYAVCWARGQCRPADCRGERGRWWGRLQPNTPTHASASVNALVSQSVS